MKNSTKNKPFSFFIPRLYYHCVGGLYKKYFAYCIYEVLRILENFFLPVSRSREISFVICSRDFSREMNRKFRNEDKPTNVLSFSSSSSEELGDIILCYDVIIDESVQYKKSLKERFSHIVLHGILHLYSFEHDTSHGRSYMESIEEHIMYSLFLCSPYEF